jgi:hypothetical protein
MGFLLPVAVAVAGAVVIVLVVALLVVIPEGDLLLSYNNPRHINYKN